MGDNFENKTNLIIHPKILDLAKERAKRVRAEMPTRDELARISRHE